MDGRPTLTQRRGKALFVAMVRCPSIPVLVLGTCPTPTFRLPLALILCLLTCITGGLIGVWINWSIFGGLSRATKIAALVRFHTTRPHFTSVYSFCRPFSVG